jgi:hypothetical protein
MQFVQDINSIALNKKNLPPWKKKLIHMFSFLFIIKKKAYTTIFALAVIGTIQIIYDYRYLMTFKSNLRILKCLE